MKRSYIYYSDIFKEMFVEKLKRNTLLFFSLVAAFVIGIIAGILMERANAVNMVYYDYCSEYYLIIFRPEYGAGGIFIQRAFGIVIYFTLLFLLSLTVYTFFLQYLLFFYKGFILGIICDIIIAKFGVSGAFIIIFITLPQNLIIFYCMAMAALCGLERALLFRRLGRVYCIKEFVFSHFKYFLCALVAVVWEITAVFVIIRPLNFFV